jgi:hypothetical protein
VRQDRWGSPTGGGYTSGTEAEWALAEDLYRDNKIRNVALSFREVDPRQLRDGRSTAARRRLLPTTKC